jgi:hypothetical protein
MMTPEQLDQRIDILVARGYTREEALQISAAIGDDIEEEAGQWIARDDNGNIIARIDPL